MVQSYQHILNLIINICELEEKYDLKDMVPVAILWQLFQFSDIKKIVRGRAGSSQEQVK